MKKIVELPLVEPLYKTYHDGIFSAIIAKNPSIRNWFLCNSIILTCSREFLSGLTTPLLRIETYGFNNTHIEMDWVSTQFLGGYINPLIRNYIDEGYYIYFIGVDDYYIPGKSWYRERHFNHDGAICGYNQIDKTYCMYAYDSNWIYQKFWTPQKAFNRGREAMVKKGACADICAIKPRLDEVAFSRETALKNLEEYLNSDNEKHPKAGEGNARGIIVHEYIAMYIDKLLDDSIPYERMDKRIFRLIWEHKKVMLELISRIEESLEMDDEISERYKPLVAEADAMRMLYAAHHMKRRDSLLPIIKNKLLLVMKCEQELLTMLVKKAKEVSGDDAVEPSEK